QTHAIDAIKDPQRIEAVCQTDAEMPRLPTPGSGIQRLQPVRSDTVFEFERAIGIGQSVDSTAQGFDPLNRHLFPVIGNPDEQDESCRSDDECRQKDPH
ncbi:MAG TPA: hypothetical protein VL475_07470, partial [Planctomycetaceae bacterium]|nr:hypothetical protein [Planctomycetaceae bacterium]